MHTYRKRYLVKTRLIRAALAFAVVGLLPSISCAATTNWINNSGGSFTASGNWDNGVPDSNDLAVFRRGSIAPYNVSVFNPIPAPFGSAIHPTINRLIIGANTVNFFSLVPSTLTVAETGRGGIGGPIGGDMIIGQTASDVAVLNLYLASLTVDDATLGSAAGSSGTLNISGSRSFDATGATEETYDLVVGSSGTGAINVTSGADVDIDGVTALGLSSTGVGNVSLGGADSTWISGPVIVGSAGTGTFTIHSGGNVTTSSGGAVYALRIGHSDTGVGEVTVNGSRSVWTSIADFLTVGDAGHGTLNIMAGGEVNHEYVTFVGTSPGSVGHVTIDGADSSLTSGYDLFGILVGDIKVGGGIGSDGTLNITRGGKVTTGSFWIGNALGQGTAHVTVDGSASTLNAGLTVWAAGTLNITNGGQALPSPGQDGFVQIGMGQGGTAEVIVDGIGSQVLSEVFCVGGSFNGTIAGAGAVTVTSRGLVSSGNGYIGQAPDSTGHVTVDGAGSTWNNTADLYVGNAGDGALDIGSGGRVDVSGNAKVGSQFGSAGSVTVDGADSALLLFLRLDVGESGTGTLNITDGGRMSVGLNAIVGTTATGVGEVNVNGAGSRWAISGDVLSIGNLGMGTLNVTNGAEVEKNQQGRIAIGSWRAPSAKS